MGNFETTKKANETMSKCENMIDETVLRCCLKVGITGMQHNEE